MYEKMLIKLQNFFTDYDIYIIDSSCNLQKSLT